MSQYSNQDKVWLVKSSGKVLGPYSADEIKFLLERRRISIIDEVRDPRIRWGFVRENPLFLDIVASLRDEEAQKLDNTTEVDPLRTRTITGTTDELTPTPTPVSNVDADLRTPEVLPRREETRAELSSIRKGGVNPSAMMSRGKPKTSLFSPAMVLLIFLGVIGAGYFFLSKGSQQKSLTSLDHIRLARGYKELGLFEKALGFYQKAASLAQLDPRSSIDIAKLYLEVKNQVVEAQRTLEAVIPNLGPNDQLKDEARLVLGLSYLRETKYDRAAQVFSNLINGEQQLNARLNLAVTKYYRGDYKGSIKDLNIYTSQGGADGVAVIAKALAQVRVHDSEGSSLKKSPVIDELDRYIRSSSEYRLEALLVRAFVYQKLNEKDSAQRISKELLEDDPTLTRSHVHDLLVDRSLVRWDNLNENCEQLTGKWSDTVLGKGVQGFCNIQLEDYERARLNLEEGLRQDPKNSILNSQYAFLLNRLKRISESQELAPKYETTSVLGARVAAMNCEELANPECAVKKWQMIREKFNMPSDLGYLHGSADYQLKKNHRDAALAFVREGLNNSPNYRPLLELKEKIDAP